MAQVIKIKRSETADSVPGSSDLATHEIAMNAVSYTHLRAHET